MRRLVAAGVAAVALAAGGALGVREWAGSAPQRAKAPTPAQLAARTRLVHEFATYGCSCAPHHPPLHRPGK